jgi:type IV/VI secretion system ImpK/VasF family protein
MQQQSDLITSNYISSGPDNIFSTKQYSSELIKNTIAKNLLLKYASPIINYVSHVCFAPNKYRKSEIESFLVNEICYFTQILKNKYKAEIILAARHILCAWINETILRSSWGKQRKWQEPKDLDRSYEESWKGESFFIIMQRCASSPNEHQDILELSYICMTLGYEGCYKFESKGYAICYTIIDSLWDVISPNITNDSCLLTTDSVNKKAKTMKLTILVPSCIIAISLIGVLCLEISLSQVQDPIMNYFDQRIGYSIYNDTNEGLYL